MSTGCIPPIPDFNTGEPTCPIGFTYDPALQLCCPNSSAPADMSDPTIRKLVLGLADHETDPSQAARLAMAGVKDSNIISRYIVMFILAFVNMLGPLIDIVVGIYDALLAGLTAAFTRAQGQSSAGFYLLAGMLVEDLLGIEANPNTLANSFAAGGRQAAMTKLGGAVFDTLAAEFLGVAQSEANGLFSYPAGTGIGGLQNKQLSPEQGIAGAKAFLGYVSGFSIREGNTDMLAALLPFGVGEFFKDFAEDFSKNLGIGRMSRLIWKPLVSTLVAKPMQDALNMQYRPIAPTVKQAFMLWLTGVYSPDQLHAALAKHGFADEMNLMLQWDVLQTPTRADLRDAHITGVVSDPDYSLWQHRLGYTDEVTTILDATEDARLTRDAVVAAAKGFAGKYLHGTITRVQFEGAINSIRHALNGQPLLSDGEVNMLLSLPSIVGAAPRRHLSVSQLQRIYADGLITLQEFEADVMALGYDADAVTELVQELLISSKRAADRAHKAATAAARGPLAKLTVAQMQTGYENGLFSVADISADLAARGYTQEAITGLLAEFRIKAGLQPPGAPTT